METTQTSTIASKDSRSAWRKTDTMWMLGLYGTAIGAGVLFLPINAGVGGMIPLIIMAILAFPMTFFAHRGLTRFVLSGKNPGEATAACDSVADPDRGYDDHRSLR